MKQFVSNGSRLKEGKSVSFAWSMNSNEMIGEEQII